MLAIRHKSCEPNFWEETDFFSISKFGSFKNSFAKIASLSGLLFRCRIFILMVQRECFLWAITASKSAENHADE